MKTYSHASICPHNTLALTSVLNGYPGAHKSAYQSPEFHVIFHGYQNLDAINEAYEEVEKALENLESVCMNYQSRQQTISLSNEDSHNITCCANRQPLHIPLHADADARRNVKAMYRAIQRNVEIPMGTGRN